MPIPEWNKTPVPVPIETLRSLTAAHGQDVAVLVTWHHEAEYNFVTIGSDSLYADAAVRLRDVMAKNLGFESLGIDRDLRHEHPNVKINQEQRDFIVWMLGYMYGESEHLDEKHRAYVLKYHNELIPVFGNAFVKPKNEEKSLSPDTICGGPVKRDDWVPRGPTSPDHS